MASLDSTERAKVALAAGESLIVTAGGQCTVQGLTGAPTTTTTLTANTQTFGPYGVSAVLLVTNVSGRTEYAANNATFELSRTEKAAFDALVSRAGTVATDAGSAWLGAPSLLSFSAVLDSGTATTVLLEVRDAVGTVATAATITADTVSQVLRQSLLLRQQSEYRFRRSSGTGSVTITV